jgi:hypothetical protein
MAECAGGFGGLELVAVVGVSEEEVEVCVDVHVDDDWGVVYDVVMQIL